MIFALPLFLLCFLCFILYTPFSVCFWLSFDGIAMQAYRENERDEASTKRNRNKKGYAFRNQSISVSFLSFRFLGLSRARKLGNATRLVYKMLNAQCWKILRTIMRSAIYVCAYAALSLNGNIRWTSLAIKTICRLLLFLYGTIS